MKKRRGDLILMTLATIAAIILLACVEVMK